MAQAALKYEPEPQETLLIPDGGIASFLTATEGDWADEEDIPQNGIAQVTHIADRLAEYGRHEDEYMVHAAEGETVIPMAVLEANPRLRKSLFAQMEIMGLDPERYVVGSELNSINPVTGQPEFFLKKLFKGVKKLVKGVVKVVKKALPYVLPVVLAMTPLGPIYGAALGSGIGTLMQGGDLGDALKAAVISGGIGGLTAGISGAVSGEGFGAGVKGAAGNVGQRFGEALGGVPEGGQYFQNPLTPRYPDATATTQLPTTVSGGEFVTPTQVAGPPPAVTPQPVQVADQLQEINYRDYAPPRIEQLQEINYRDYAPPRIDVDKLPVYQGSLQGVDQNLADPSMWDKAKSWFTPGGRQDAYVTNMEMNALQQGGYSSWEAVNDAVRREVPGALDAFNAARNAGNLALTNQGILSQYGPSMVGAGLVGGAAGMFDQPEPEDDEDEDDPYKDHDPLAYQQYQIAFPTAPTYTMEDIRVPGREVGFAAGGGGVASLEEARAFPRRSGGIAGPGTGRSDDVPAMLSDGEFVMTARAVKGAGNGSRKNGMKNMYQMMRTFEGAA